MTTVLSQIRTSFVVALALAVGTFLSNSQATADVLSDILSECQNLGASQYQIMFTSQGVTDATSTDINYYNGFVRDQAAAASTYLNQIAPGATWNAIASTPTADARDNVPTSAYVPIFDTLGHLLYAGGDGTTIWSGQYLQAPILYDQYGDMGYSRPIFTESGLQDVDFHPPYAWTGTNRDGKGAPGNELGTPYPVITQFNFTNALNEEGPAPPNSWTPSSTDQLYMLALSSEIPATVPEPTTLLVWSGLGAVGLIAAWRKRKQAA
jgi:hypothetical protein